MIIELKDCPFCNGTATIFIHNSHDNLDELYKVMCTNNNCKTGQPWNNDQAKVIVNWNRRA